jgi:hypothetical protein
LTLQVRDVDLPSEISGSLINAGAECAPERENEAGFIVALSAGGKSDALSMHFKQLLGSVFLPRLRTIPELTVGSET